MNKRIHRGKNKDSQGQMMEEGGIYKKDAK